MKHLSDYALEKLFINEASTIGNSNGHFFHQSSWDYPINVINKLLDNKNVHTGKDGKGPILTKDDFNIEKLEELQDKLNKKLFNPDEVFGPDEFDKCLKNNIKETKFKNIKGSVWGYIHKPDAKTGTNDGWAGEILTCCIYNDNNCNVNEIAAALEINNSWVESSRLIAKILNDKWSSNDFIAVQVSGEDTQFIDKDKTDTIKKYLNDAKKISSDKLTILYNDKIAASKLVGLNLDDLYLKSKDAWNKADILLISKDFDIDKEIFEKCLKSDTTSDGGPQVADSYTFNNLLISLCNNARIIPVSLKKVVKNATLTKEGEKTISLEELNFVDNSITISCILPDLKELKKNNINTVNKNSSAQYNRVGSTYIGDKQNKTVTPPIQFRRRNPNNGEGKDTKINYGTLIVELMGKNAREGRGLENIKNVLGIKKNEEFLNPFNFEETEDKEGNPRQDLSNVEIKRINQKNKTAEKNTLEYYKNLLDNSSYNELEKYTNSNSDDYIINWYKKPCFAGFVGLHNIWYHNKYLKDVKPENKEKDLHSTLNAFYSFLLGCCKGLLTGNNYIGQYWLVK